MSDYMSDLDFNIRFLRTKCETSLGFELDRL